MQCSTSYYHNGKFHGTFQNFQDFVLEFQKQGIESKKAQEKILSEKGKKFLKVKF